MRKHRAIVIISISFVIMLLVVMIWYYLDTCVYTVSAYVTQINYNEEITDDYFVSQKYDFPEIQNHSGENQYSEEIQQHMLDDRSSYKYYQVHYNVQTSRTIADIEININGDYGSSIVIGNICDWYPVFEPYDNSVEYIFPIYVNSNAFSDEEIESVLSELQFILTYKNTYGMINCDYILGLKHKVEINRS